MNVLPWPVPTKHETPMEQQQIDTIQKLQKKIKRNLDKVVPHPYDRKGNELKAAVIRMVQQIVEIVKTNNNETTDTEDKEKLVQKADHHRRAGTVTTVNMGKECV